MRSTEPNSDSGRTSMTSDRSFNSHERTPWLAQRMANALAMYPSANLTIESKALLLREWDLILQEVGRELFDRALAEHIRESKFFPTVAELRDRAGISKNDHDAVEANAAWEFVNRYMS